MMYGILANYQTTFDYKLMNDWYAQSDSVGRLCDHIQTQSTQA